MREDRVHWTLDQMQAYFTIIKGRRPEFTREAQEILSAYYQLQRQKDNRDKARTTIRLLESLIRLAEGHARLMYREIVLPLDDIQAVHLMEKSLVTTNSIRDYTVLQTTFPEDPELTYSMEENYILKMLFPRDHHEGKLDDFKQTHDYAEDIKRREIEESTRLMMQGDMFGDIDFEEVFESTNNVNKDKNVGLGDNHNRNKNKNVDYGEDDIMSVGQCSQDSNNSSVHSIDPTQAKANFAKPTTSLAKTMNLSVSDNREGNGNGMADKDKTRDDDWDFGFGR